MTENSAPTSLSATPMSDATVEMTTISLERPARAITPETTSTADADVATRATAPSPDMAPAAGDANASGARPATPVSESAAVGPAPSAQPAPPPRLGALLLVWRATIMDAMRRPALARYGAYASAGAVALAAGWMGAHFLNATSRNASASVAFAAQTDARLEKLSEDMRLLRESVAALNRPPRPPEALKPINDRVAALADSIDRFRADQGGKIGALTAAVERIEKVDRESNARIAQIAERLDRNDRAAPVTTGSIPAPAPAAAPSPPNPPPRPEASERPNVTSVEQRPAPKQIEGWALREVYNGVALVENRRAGLLEVQPGQVVRGLGRIERIERRGRQWVVVTDQGVVSTN